MLSTYRDVDRAYQYRFFGAFRLLLATLVMVQHFGADLAPAPLALALAPFSVGSVAVLVFFALSGFVITEAVDSVYRDRPGSFLTNRLLRIVPHFVAAVILAMLAHEFFRIAGGTRLWRSQPSFPADAFALPNVLLNFVAMLPMGERIIRYNFLTITWALRVEMTFYLGMYACIIIGRRLSHGRGFALTATVLSGLLLPLMWFAIHKRLPDTLMFTPYFAFGGALYFATCGARTGWVIALVSVPLILWQFIEDQIRTVPLQGVPFSITGNLIVLVLLLGGMTVLAFTPIKKGRTIDRVLGNLTYPVYLYHEAVLIVVLTVTTEYAYSTLAVGVGLSFVLAALMMALIDPAVARHRDRVRGGGM